MGWVVLAHDRELDRLVAVKLSLLSEPATRRRFLREAETLSRIQHPHVVRVFEAGEARDGAYVVMEFLEGASLEDEPALGDPLEVLRPIAGALEAVHEHGLIHRDLKPGNIVRAGDGRPVLIDFGLILDAEQTALTKAGSFVGTVAYMAPERLREGAAVTAAVDWYAWGVTAYQLLEGRAPFAPQAVAAWALAGERPPLEFSRSAPGDPLRVVIEACMDEDPAARPRSLAEVDRLLAGRALAGREDSRGSAGRSGARAPVSSSQVRGAASSASPGEAGPPGRPWRPLLGIAGALTVALGLGAWRWSRSSEVAARPGPGEVAVQVGGASTLAGSLPPSESPQLAGLEVDDEAAGLRLLGVNAAGLREYRHLKDGSVLIEVPGGTFRPPRRPDEAPRGLRQVPGFLVAKFELSVAQYDQFLADTDAAEPHDWGRQLEHPERPVGGLTVPQADAYLEWAGLRLPTCDEWLRSAGGVEGWPYPWGLDPPSAARTNIETGFVLDLDQVWRERLLPVDSLPAGDSPVGARQMLGNIDEVCWDPAEGRKAKVGGNLYGYRYPVGSAYWAYDGDRREFSQEYQRRVDAGEEDHLGPLAFADYVNLREPKYWQGLRVARDLPR